MNSRTQDNKKERFIKAFLEQSSKLLEALEDLKKALMEEQNAGKNN